MTNTPQRPLINVSVSVDTDVDFGRLATEISAAASIIARLCRELPEIRQAFGSTRVKMAEATGIAEHRLAQLEKLGNDGGPAPTFDEAIRLADYVAALMGPTDVPTTDTADHGTGQASE